MNRRAFVTGLGVVLAVPLADAAQHTGKVARVAFLETASLAANASLRTRFQEQLRELGHIEGRTIAFEARAADGRNERLLGLADELVRLNVDVIVVAGTAAAIAAKRVTSVVPIVMAIVSDPVNLGLVGSLARPGGNVTGVADLYVELTGKRLELLKEILPRLARVALISKTDHPKPQEALREAEGAARALGVQLQSVGVRDPREFGGAFSKIVQDHADAVIFEADALFISQRSRLVDLTVGNRLPAIFWRSEFVDAGGLMSYGTSYADLWRRAAIYVDKILKGAKPADLPVEQPTKFELVINLKTAKALGLTISPSLLLRADQVIE